MTVLARRLADHSPPLAAWACGLLVLCVTAAATGHDPFAPSTWTRWDSGHYLEIAAHDYDVHRCAGSATTWCGNAAWFPGYPALIAALHQLGIPFGAAGVAIAWTFALAAIVALWQWFLRDRPAAVAALGLAYAAFAPGQVYEYAVFPLSMFVTFTVAFLALMLRGRWLAAGLAGLAAGLCYPVGVLIPVVAAAWTIGTRRRVRTVLLVTVPAALAFPAVLLVQRVQTGRWTAFFDVQAEYSASVHDPFGVLWNQVLLLARSDRPFDHAAAPVWQTIIVTAIVAAVVARAVVRRRRLERTDVLLTVWAVAAWALPLTQASVSVWRSHAALMPIALVVARLPRAAAVAAVAALVTLSVPMARLFFEGRLI